MNDLKKMTIYGLSIILCIVSVAPALGLQFEKIRIEGFHPLDEESYEASPLNSQKPVILKLNSKIFKDTSVVDFEKRQITFRRGDALGYTMWEYHFSELSDYLSSRRNYILFKGWYRDALAVKRSTDAKKQQQALKMEWEMPVQYPSWAQRVLGNEPPRLRIDGNLTIEMGFDRSTVKDAYVSEANKDASNNFGFKMNYQFGINGTVGKLINVSIRVVDDEFVQENNFKNFKIEYKESTPGEMEDEIIQEVIAGWTSFEMPGTELTGTYGGKDGLFGIKIKSKLGPLTLTTIASQEKGEATKSSYSTKKGGSTRPIAIDEYKPNKIFFVDTLYRSYYNKNNSITNREKVVAPGIDTLIAFMQLNQIQSTETTQKPIPATVDRGSNQVYFFKKLVEGTHYELDRNEGWIRFDTTIGTSDHIALYMRSADDTTLNRGSVVIGDTLRYENLWTIKPSEPIYEASTDPARFYLMWRNVYDLDTNNLSSFEITVKKYTDDGADTTARTPDNKLITEVLGLTDANGKALTSDTKMYDKSNGLIIIPPFDTCSTCNEPFNNEALGQEFRDTVLYRFQPANQKRGYKPIYSLVTSGSKQESTIQLSWQVMPGSELVKTFAGEKLDRDRDYIIDYESGALELISPRALAADGVDVSYQNEALFVPESKAFLGARGEIALPFLSEKSFIGGLILFQSASSNDIPRLGQEPYSKLLFDVNTKIDLQPEWMTELVDQLPLVQTSEASSAIFEFEVAHSRTNPNTNEKSYLDDFEDTKKPYLLGSYTTSWYKASPPYLHLLRDQTGSVDSLFMYDSIYHFPPAWDFYWFSPQTNDKSMRDSVWVRTTTKSTLNDDGYDPILRLHCTPAPDSDSLSPLYKNAWAGIMTSVSQSSFGQSEYKYFEFVANRKSRSGKKLIIQMGIMNEDVSINGGPPNRKGDYEDSTLSGTRNPNLDLGLDRTDDKDEFYLIPRVGSVGMWDTLYYGDPLLGYYRHDPAKDNYKGPNNQSYENDAANRRHASKLQGDNRWTSEDIGYDGTVQYGIKESYYEFTIDLDDTLFIDKTARIHTENGWRKYRIPILNTLSIKDSVNSPAWNRISMVRLIWTDFDSTSLTNEQSLLISDPQFTGNIWLEETDSSKNAQVEATALSNQEDLRYANNGADSRINRKKISGTNEYELEQALKISFSNVQYQDPAFVTRSYRYQKMDISQYRRMTLLYFGDTLFNNRPDADGVLYNGDLRFVFRFGSNDSTYYEYHDKVRVGWQQAIIDLQALTKLKDDFVIKNPGIAINATSGNYSVVAKKIGTEPSIANISWMALGVDVPIDNGSNSYKGAIWINELLVDGISQMNGWAARTSLKTKFADFLNIDVYANYSDGDFKMMNEAGYSAKESKLRTNVSASVNADRFFPRNWGVNLPIGGTISSDIERPQLKSNSDMRLENDGIMAMISDAFETIMGNSHTDSSSSESEKYGKKRFSSNVYSNYSKNTKSDNPLVNMTVDRISTNVSHTRSVTLDNLGPSPDESFIYSTEVSSKDYVGKLSYDLSPENPPEWTKWKPFGSTNAEQESVLRRYEFALLPTTLKFDLADVNYGHTTRQESKTGVNSDVYRYDLKHGFKFNYRPIDPLLQINYDISINRDLDSVGRYGTNEDKINVIIDKNDEWNTYNVLQGEINRSQQLQLSLKPEILSWLTTNFDYSSAFTSRMVTQRNESQLYMNATVRPRFSFTSSWEIGTMFRKLAELTKKSSSGSFFAQIDTGYRKVGLRTITFSYSAETNLKNDYLGVEYLDDVSFWDFFRYQTGFYGRDNGVIDYMRGSMNDNDLGGMRSRQKTDSSVRYMYDTKNITRRYTISTGLDLKIPFEISFSPISFEWSNSVNLISRDTTNFDSTITFPKIQAGANTSALMKLDFIKDHFKSFRCNSTYNYEKTETKSIPRNFKESRKISMRPFLAVFGDLAAAPVSVNYNYNRSMTNDKLGIKPDSITTTTSDKVHEHDFTVNYEIQKNSRLSEVKIFKWTIPVSGKTTVGFKGSLKTQLSVKDYLAERNDDGGIVSDTTANLLSYSLSPKVTYIFTSNFDGEASWQFGQERDRKTGVEQKVKTNNKFAIILKVKF